MSPALEQATTIPINAMKIYFLTLNTFHLFSISYGNFAILHTIFSIKLSPDLPRCIQPEMVF